MFHRKDEVVSKRPFICRTSLEAIRVSLNGTSSAANHVTIPAINMVFTDSSSRGASESNDWGWRSLGYQHKNSYDARHTKNGNEGVGAGCYERRAMGFR